MEYFTSSRDVNHGFQINGPHAELDDLRRFIEAPEACLHREPNGRGALRLTADWIESIHWKSSKTLDRLDCWFAWQWAFSRSGRKEQANAAR